MCMCVCLCVKERECVSVCVREKRVSESVCERRERESVFLCVCVCERESVSVCVNIGDYHCFRGYTRFKADLKDSMQNIRFQCIAIQTNFTFSLERFLFLILFKI